MNVTDRQTDRQTEPPLAIARSNDVLKCIGASVCASTALE